MDFGRDCLVFVKGEEKTDELAELGIIGASITVKYKGKDLIYSYDTNSATIISDPVIIGLSDGTVLYENNIPLSDVTEVYKFAGYYSVYFSKGRKTYPEASIYVARNMYDADKFPDISYVHPDSVLYKYMNGWPAAPKAADGCTTVYPFDYNLCEKDAVEKALMNDVSIIDAPPGSLKAETIMNLILNLAVVRGKTVAYVAPEKVFLDAVYGRMKEEGLSSVIARPGEHIPGSAEEGDSNESAGDAVKGKAVGDLNQTLEKYMELEKREKLIQEELSLYQLEQKHFLKDKNDKPAKKMPVFPGIKWDSGKTIRLWADIQLFLSETKETSLSSMCHYLTKYCITDFDEVLLKIDESVYCLQKLYYAGKTKELENELKTIRAELKKRDYKRMLEYQKELSSRNLKDILRECYSGSPYDPDWETFKEKEKFEEFIRRCPVVFSICRDIKDSVRDNYIFDYLIVDESALTDIQTGIAALACCKNAVIVGYSQDSSARSFFSSVKGVFGETAPATMLLEYYPDPPDVIRFCNDKYLRGRLIPYHIEKPAGENYSRQEIETLREEITKVSAEVLGGYIPEGDRSDIGHYLEYLSLEDGSPDDRTVPVPDLLYRDLNTVLVQNEKRVLKKYRYRSENVILNLLNDILTQGKYKDLRFNYNMRVADIVKEEENPDRDCEEVIKKHYVDFTVYNRYEKKPKLVIEVDGLPFKKRKPEYMREIRLKDAFLRERGVHVIRLANNSRDEAKHIIQGLETAFYTGASGSR